MNPTVLRKHDPLLLPPSFQGDLTEAKVYYERCQAIQEKALGPEHPDVAKTLHNRAGLLKAQVRYQRSFQGMYCVARRELQSSSIGRCCWKIN